MKDKKSLKKIKKRAKRVATYMTIGVKLNGDLTCIFNTYDLEQAHEKCLAARKEHRWAFVVSIIETPNPNLYVETSPKKKSSNVMVKSASVL